MSMKYDHRHICMRCYYARRTRDFGTPLYCKKDGMIVTDWFYCSDFTREAPGKPAPKPEPAPGTNT